MTTRHTPGPWDTDEREHDTPLQNIKIKARRHRTVCTVWIDYAPPVHDFNAEQWANARLIAAAPDLLAALQAFADEIVPNNPNDPLWINARAAIAKATGEA